MKGTAGKCKWMFEHLENPELVAKELSDYAGRKKRQNS